MEDDTSWQELMALNSSEEDCICSPILYKNKWLLLPQWDKQKSNDTLLLKGFREDSSSSGIFQSEVRPQIRKSGNGGEPGAQFASSTPTRRARPSCKRKRLDYSDTCCSHPSQKVKPHQTDLNTKLFSENDSCMVAGDVDASAREASTSSERNGSGPVFSGKPRKLLYCLNENIALKSPEKPCSVEELFRAAQLVEEADMMACVKNPRDNRVSDGGMTCRSAADGVKGALNASDDLKEIISLPHERKEVISRLSENLKGNLSAFDNYKESFSVSDNVSEVINISNNMSGVIRGKITSSTGSFIEANSIESGGPSVIESKMTCLIPEVAESVIETVFKTHPDLPSKKTNSSRSDQFSQSVPNDILIRVSEHHAQIRNSHRASTPDVSPPIVETGINCQNAPKNCQKSNVFSEGFTQYFDILLSSSNKTSEMDETDALFGKANGLEMSISTEEQTRRNCDTASTYKSDLPIVKFCEDTSLEKNLDGRIVIGEKTSGTAEDKSTLSCPLKRSVREESARVGLASGASLQLVTGRGKSVAISNIALNKVKSLFGEDFLSIESDICGTNLEERGLSLWPNEYGGMPSGSSENGRQCPGLGENGLQCSGLGENGQQCSGLGEDGGHCSGFEENGGQCSGSEENGGPCSGPCETDTNFAATVDIVVISQQNLVTAESLLGSESRNGIDFALNEVSVPAYFSGNFKNSVVSDACDKDMKEHDFKEENAIEKVDDHGYLPAGKYNISASKNSIREVFHVEPHHFDYSLTCEDITILHSPPRENTSEIDSSTTADIKVPIFEKSSDNVKTLFEGNINDGFLMSLRTNTHSNGKQGTELIGMEEATLIKQKHQSGDSSVRQDNRNNERIQESVLCEETDMFSENNSSNAFDNSVASVQFCTARGSKIQIFQKDLEKLGSQYRELSDFGSDLIESTSKFPFSVAWGCHASVSKEKVECLNEELSEVAQSPGPGREDASERLSSRVHHLSMAPSAEDVSGGQTIATVSGSQHSKIQHSGSSSERVNSFMQTDDAFVKSVKKCCFSSERNSNRISVSEKGIESASVLLKNDVADLNFSKNNFSEDDSFIVQNNNFTEEVSSIIKIPKSEEKIQFSTANGNKISVSNKSLESARALLREDLAESNSRLNNFTKEGSSIISIPKSEEKFQFSTASGNKISVSNKSLESARALLREDLAESNSRLNNFTKEGSSIISIPKSEEKFQFSTASGNKISVSNKSLESARVLLRDDVAESNSRLNNFTEEDSSIISIPKSEEKFQFSTASGNKISVSNKSLESARALLRDDVAESNSRLNNFTEEDSSIISIPKSEEKFQFSTASGNKISVSNKSLESARALLRDDVAESNSRLNNFTKEGSSIISIPKSEEKFQFSTASGNKISVSNKSLESARVVLRDDVAESNSRLNNFTEEDSSIISIPKSEEKFQFSTASGNKISVSNKSLESARALLRDDVAESNSRLNNFTKEGSSIISIPKSEEKFQFSTASGNKISVSNKSLESARALLRDDVAESNSRLNNFTEEDSSIISIPKSEEKFQFSTASGNKISVSNKSLESARALLRDDVAESNSRLNNFTKEGSSIISIPKSEEKFQFSTASGNKISVSNKSLESARVVLRDDVAESNSRLNNFTEEDSSIISIPKSEEKFQFSTASGNKISVSNKSLESARALLRDDVAESNSRLNNFTKEGSSIISIPKSEEKFQFSTASGNKISVSNKSLESARALLRDDVAESNSRLNNFTEEDSSIISIPKSEEKFQFSTASGNKISVSNKSLESARALLRDDVAESNSSLNNFTEEDSSIISIPKSVEKFQFSTASGNKISISNKSLESARALLRDDEAESTSGDKGQFQFSVSHSEMSVSAEHLRNFKERNSSISHSETTTSEKRMENNRFLLEKKCSFEENLNNPHDDREKKVMINEKTFNFLTAGGMQQDGKSFVQFTDGGSSVNVSKERSEDVISIHSGDLTECASPSISSEDGNLECQVVPEETAGSNSVWEEGGTSVSQMTTLLEVGESAMALLADSESPTPRPYFTSPAMFADRGNPSLRPVISWGMEMDEEAALLVAQTAEAALHSAHLKRKSTHTLHSPSLEKKPKLMSMSDTDSVDVKEIIQSRKIQREKQEMYIKEKLSKPPVYLEGSYLLCRNEGGTTPLQNILANPLTSTHEELLELYNNLREEILEVTSRNAGDFKLQTEWFFPGDVDFCKSGSIQLKNGFTLVPADDNSLGVDQISACFLSHPHVDPALVPPRWVRNHYRWIVWKLASLERRFPHPFAPKYVTPENILEQLRYRYDRELYRAERPALKKILERDEPSWRRMILCVADIAKTEPDDGVELELTDGWYSVWTEIDAEMVGLVRRGRLASGDKIVTHGAELVNSQDGIDPLQNQSVRLKVHTNSTRRARWDAKLGFMRCPGPLPVYLGATLPRGGALGRLTALVPRTYPLLYMAREPQGKTVVRNAQAESYVAAQFEKNHSKLAEKIYEEALKEVEKKYKQGGTKVKYDLKNIKSIRNVDALWRLVSNASDPSELQSLLSEDQRRQVEEYHEFVMSRIRGEVEVLAKQRVQQQQPPRRVTVMFKVRLVDPRSDTDALLTIWNPSEDLRQLIKENKVIEFYSLTASGLRENVLQLCSTKTSRYREVAGWCPGREADFKRVVTGVSELVVEQSSLRPLFGEMDTVGVVVLVRAPEQPWGVTQVYLADLNFNFLRVTFWTSLKSFGWEECVREGSIVVGANLHWRSGSGAFLVPSLYASHLTHFSVRPTYGHLAAELLKYNKHFENKSIEEFVENGKSRLLCLIKEKEPGDGGTPSRQTTPGTERVRRVIAGRLERQFCSPAPLSSVALLGNPETGEGGTPAGRLKRLSQYGTPTPLPRIALFSSPLVSRSFKSPKLVPPSQLHSV